jgi:hypothetical protein
MTLESSHGTRDGKIKTAIPMSFRTEGTEREKSKALQ